MNFFVADMAASPGGERRADLSGGRCWNVVEPGTEKVGWEQRSKRREESKRGLLRRSRCGPTAEGARSIKRCYLSESIMLPGVRIKENDFPASRGRRGLVCTPPRPLHGGALALESSCDDGADCHVHIGAF